MKIKIALTGIEEQLRKLEKAGKSVEPATEKAMFKGATVYHDAIEAAVKGANIDNELKAKMLESLLPPTVIKFGNAFWASTGFKMGEYDPTNPSGGYLASFYEFGTIVRKTEAGKNRGSIQPPMNVIIPAIKKARPKATKAITAGINEIMGD